jgi:2-C-methyl-D-erythritol 2,4-cyclodiphosphate synthase
LLRIGTGYDIHRLGAGRRLVLGGVEVPHSLGPVGHSDGDVLIHAIIDAVLGACALGDIGTHFPDDDPAYEAISSITLLKRVMVKVGERAKVENVDSTVVAEEPRLAGHVPRMRSAIADAMGMSPDRISIKAKTGEGLGPVGKGEAIEAYAVALLDLHA